MDAWSRFRRNRLALVGLVLVVVLALSALLAPWLAPYDPARQSLIEKRARPGAQVRPRAPTSSGATSSRA